MNIFDEQLTEHFNRQEFVCCCEGRYCDGFPGSMNMDLVLRLEATRMALGQPIIITSGLRCPTGNQEVGGILYSRHLVGAAADCYCPGVSVFDLADAGMREGLGVIIYEDEGFCHFEI